jgi:flagellar biosynthesis/type III secretory pathway protein FliH
MSDDDRIIEAKSLTGLVRRLFDNERDIIIDSDTGEALVEARGIVEAARSEAEQIRETARRSGLKQGLEEVARVLEELDEQRAVAVRRADDDVVELAMATAHKLILSEIERRPEVMVELVGQAMTEITRARTVVIWVSPQAGAAVEAGASELSARLPGAKISVRTEESLAAGDCVIETDLGRVDARLRVQLRSILEALRGGETT